MYGNSSMFDGYSRGHGGMWAGHLGGGFDSFGPASLFTFGVFSILFIIALVWVVAIKGYALWHAAKRNEKWWFIALLVVNTFGLLEIVYLLFFAKVWTKEKLIHKEGAHNGMHDDVHKDHEAHHPSHPPHPHHHDH